MKAFAGSGRRSHAATRLNHQSSGRDRLHVGVLPFLPSHGPKDEDLASAISQDIAVALARYSWFDVVPPRSLADRSAATFMNEGWNQFLDLDYVVEGAVSSSGKRVQVSIRLLDLGECARTIWSERLVLLTGKPHGWSETVAARIAGGIDPIILFFDRQPQKRRRDGAAGLIILATPLMSRMERRKIEKAGRIIDQADEI